MGLHFDTVADVSHYLDVLLAAAADNSEKFSVYTPQTMPERYHFAHSPRIAPVYVRVHHVISPLARHTISGPGFACTVEAEMGTLAFLRSDGPRSK